MYTHTHTHTHTILFLQVVQVTWALMKFWKIRGNTKKKIKVTRNLISQIKLRWYFGVCACSFLSSFSVPSSSLLSVFLYCCTFLSTHRCKYTHRGNYGITRTIIWLEHDIWKVACQENLKIQEGGVTRLLKSFEFISWILGIFTRR